MYAVVPAAGLGSRMNTPEGVPRNIPQRSKVFLSLDRDLSVLELALRNIVAAQVVRGIVVLVKPGEEEFAKSALAKEANGLERFVALGGATRQQSVYSGLCVLSGKAQYVLVHDGARPLCSPSLIAHVATTAVRLGAAILATPAKQSLKEVSDGESIHASLPRARIWEAQTPQVFRYSEIREAHELAKELGYEATDDSELVERLGKKVVVVRGDDRNIKITTPTDLELAQFFLQGNSFSSPR